MAGLSRGEVARKVVHMGVGGIAFAVRFLGPVWSPVCAGVALLFNLFVLPRIGGRRLWRASDREQNFATGIVLYPLAVLLLLLIYHRRLEVAAAVWGILAFGDGSASLAGMALGRRKLPWNPEKSWMGTAAYGLFGALAAWALLLWTAPGRYGWTFALGVAVAAALFAALLESMPQGLDDNLGVPLVTSAVLFCLLLTEGRWGEVVSPDLARQAAVGGVVSGGLAGAAYGLRSVNRAGAMAGFFLGTAIYAFLGWRGFLLLAAFFVLGSGATQFGYRVKEARRLAQEEGGRRSARHALAKGAVPALCALFAVATPYPELFTVAFAAALATAASDTAASEVGQVLGRRTFLLTSFRRVPPGTQGAVSLEGTVAGILASLVLGFLGLGLGLFPAGGVGVVALAALVATTLESLVGATLERRGLLDNQGVNFLNTLAGALVGAALFPWVGV